MAGPISLNWTDATVYHGEYKMIRTMMLHWPLMAMVFIVVTLMCVADMNWPGHMGDRGGLMSLVVSGL